MVLKLCNCTIAPGWVSYCNIHFISVIMTLRATTANENGGEDFGDGPSPGSEPHAPLFSPAMRVIGVLLACAGVVGYALWLASGVLVKEGNWVGVDFHVYYTAAHVLEQGQDIYTAGISPPYVYPPLLAILTLPLAALPVNAATIIWKL